MTKRTFVPSLRIDDPERTRVRTAPRPHGKGREGAARTDPPLDEPADLYYPRRAKGLGYRHFNRLAEALEFARDTLTPSQRGGCVIQLGETRLEAADVARLLASISPSEADT